MLVRRFARGEIGQGIGGHAEGIAGACKQGLCGVGGFRFGRFGRYVKPGRVFAAERGRWWPERGGLRRGGLRAISGAIPCETQAGSMRAFLPGLNRASSSEPGFWSRRDGLRRLRPGCRFGSSVRVRQVWQDCAGFGGLYDFAGLAGSAGMWHRSADIPETGDPRCRSHMPAPHAPSVSATCR